MYITTILFSWNDEKMIPFQLRNAKKYSDRIVLFDDGSTDGTVEISRSEGVEVIDFTDLSHGQYNEGVLIKLKNEAYKSMPGDWFLIHDIDELIWCREGVRQQLEDYSKCGVTLPVIDGYNMVVENAPSPGDDLVMLYRYGVPSQYYCKQVAVHKSCDVRYKPGAHSCEPENAIYSSSSPIKLFHYHSTFGVEFQIQRCILKRNRFSDANIQNGWASHYNTAETAVPRVYAEDFKNKQLIPL